MSHFRYITRPRPLVFLCQSPFEQKRPENDGKSPGCFFEGWHWKACVTYSVNSSVRLFVRSYVCSFVGDLIVFFCLVWGFCFVFLYVVALVTSSRTAEDGLASFVFWKGSSSCSCSCCYCCCCCCCCCWCCCCCCCCGCSPHAILKTETSPPDELAVTAGDATLKMKKRTSCNWKCWITNWKAKSGF